MVDLKVHDLQTWRKERVSDAELICMNDAFLDLVRRAFGGSPDAGARALLYDWLRQVQQRYGYIKVSLHDAQGNMLISIPDTPPGASRLEGISQTLRSGKIHLEDFRQYEPGTVPRLTLLAPVLDPSAGGRPLGIVALQIDPTRYLFPFIKRWPTLSPTAETLLVRRDGSDVLFLNELRFRKGSAYRLRIPLTQTDLPAAKAVLGQVGIVKGTDYNGQPVLAALRAVEDTPWFMVARVATRELFESTAETVALAAGTLATVLFTFGIVMRIIWRQQLRLRYQERFRADELERAARKLIRSNEALEQFAYVASHDLQEPLRMVVGYVQLLEKRLAGKLDEETRNFMAFAMDGALRMQGLIQDILAYSRVTTKGRPLASVDSAAALKEALALLANLVAETGAEITVQTLPVVTADPAQLTQLFQNLIGNAIKFCKDRAPRVQVEAVFERGWWRFSVTDNGIGIAPDTRATVRSIQASAHAA